MISAARFFNPNILLLSVLMCSPGPRAGAENTNVISTAATVKTQASPLPDAWNGVWRGQVKVSVDGETRHEVNLDLTIAKIPERTAKTWTMQYTGQPPRNYELAPAETGRGLFILDEKNGTLIEEQLIGETLYAIFSVDNVLLTSRFELRGRELHLEIATYDHSVKRTKTNAASQAVVYPFRSIQSGILRRQKK
jgi:hypothetical protein